MLRYLLEDVYPLHQYPGTLLVPDAAGAFRTDSVKLLLQHGGTVGRGKRHPVVEAVSAGSLEL